MKTVQKKYRPILIGLLAFWIFLVPAAHLALPATTDKLPPPQPSLDERMAQPVTFDFREVPIELVLAQLAEQAGVDFIKSKDVTGDVTAKVTDIPLGEALENVLAAHQWGYLQSKNMIRIVELTEIAREEDRKGKLEKDRREALVQEEYVTDVFRITYADVTEVAEALKQFLSERGALVVIRGTSDIMITETESRMSAIKKFLEEIDRITPQILVEVRIYDLTHQDQLDLGVDWAIGRNTVFDDAGNPVGGRLEPFIVSGFKGATDFAENAEGLIRFGMLNSSINLDAVIKAQQETVDAELLANPRVRVLDNETATIKIVREIPFTEVNDTSQGGMLTSTQFKEVGVMLQVTPHVTREGMIRLHVMPEFGVVVGESETGAPIIDTRKTDTVLLVPDTQTVVLGGLRTKETRNSVRKIPVLGDLPLLGALFRAKGRQEVISELVVFITPRIVEDADLSLTETWDYRDTEWKLPPNSQPLSNKYQFLNE